MEENRQDLIASVPFFFLNFPSALPRRGSAMHQSRRFAWCALLNRMIFRCALAIVIAADVVLLSTHAYAINLAAELAKCCGHAPRSAAETASEPDTIFANGFDDNGSQCLTTADCPATGSQCSASTCTLGTCGVANASSGTMCTAGGNCTDGVCTCNGVGTCLEACTNPTLVCAPLLCFTGSCSGTACVYVPDPDGTSCGVLSVCKSGSCVPIP